MRLCEAMRRCLQKQILPRPRVRHRACVNACGYAANLPTLHACSRVRDGGCRPRRDRLRPSFGAVAWILERRGVSVGQVFDPHRSHPVGPLPRRLIPARLPYPSSRVGLATHHRDGGEQRRDRGCRVRHSQSRSRAPDVHPHVRRPRARVPRNSLGLACPGREAEASSPRARARGRAVGKRVAGAPVQPDPALHDSRLPRRRARRRRSRSRRLRAARQDEGSPEPDRRAAARSRAGGPRRDAPRAPGGRAWNAVSRASTSKTGRRSTRRRPARFSSRTFGPAGSSSRTVSSRPTRRGS